MDLGGLCNCRYCVWSGERQMHEQALSAWLANAKLEGRGKMRSDRSLNEQDNHKHSIEDPCG